MKNIIKLGVLILFIGGCQSANIYKNIPYILPHSVESQLYQIVKEYPDKIFSFRLAKESNEIYKINVIENKNEEEIKAIDSFDYIEKSNRKVLINDSFYPLVFESDYVFGTDMKKTEFCLLYTSPSPRD